MDGRIGTCEPKVMRVFQSLRNKQQQRGASINRQIYDVGCAGGN